MQSLKLKNDLEKFYVPPVIAESIQLEGSTSGSFNRFALAVKQNPPGKKALMGSKFKPARFNSLGMCSSDRLITPFLPLGKRGLSTPLLDDGIMQKGGMKSAHVVDIPKFGSIVTDCAKMRVFADLMTRLQAEKHRCLVFC